jgi:DNA-binding NtrC family response regulator
MPELLSLPRFLDRQDSETGEARDFYTLVERTANGAAIIPLVQGPLAPDRPGGAPVTLLVRSGGELEVRVAAGSAPFEHSNGEAGRSLQVAPGEPFIQGDRCLAVMPGRLADDGSWWLELGGFIARSEAAMAALFDAATFARTDSPVLIGGESGTGKELIAHLVHRLSVRRHAPYVAINCASIPDGLADTELFGHERGAFTGAIGQREGLFDRADGGTLFLDEIAELAPPVQARLLRALESGEVRRVGGRGVRHVDVRVVSASHRRLGEEVQGGAFREDLFHRLAVLTLTLPPLRERRADIAPLARTLLARMGHRRGIAPDALQALAEAPWPGNVRALRNALAAASARSLGHRIEPRHLRLDRSAPEPQGRLDTVIDDAILAELRRQGGSRRRTYETLGISRSSFYRWLERNRDRAPAPAR